MIATNKLLPRRLRSYLHLMMGKLWLHAGRHEKARLELETALACGGELFSARVALSRIALSSGDLERAAAELAKACACNPERFQRLERALRDAWCVPVDEPAPSATGAAPAARTAPHWSPFRRPALDASPHLRVQPASDNQSLELHWDFREELPEIVRESGMFRESEILPDCETECLGDEAPLNDGDGEDWAGQGAESEAPARIRLWASFEPEEDFDLDDVDFDAPEEDDDDAEEGDFDHVWHEFDEGPGAEPFTLDWADFSATGAFRGEAGESLPEDLDIQEEAWRLAELKREPRGSDNEEGVSPFDNELDPCRAASFEPPPVDEAGFESPLASFYAELLRQQGGGEFGPDQPCDDDPLGELDESAEGEDFESSQDFGSGYDEDAESTEPSARDPFEGIEGGSMHGRSGEREAGEGPAPIRREEIREVDWAELERRLRQLGETGGNE